LTQNWQSQTQNGLVRRLNENGSIQKVQNQSSQRAKSKAEINRKQLQNKCSTKTFRERKLFPKWTESQILLSRSKQPFRCRNET